MSRIPSKAPGWGHNLGLKALSLVLAFGVWLYVNSQGMITVNFAVPIEPVGLADELVLTHMDVETVDLRLSGRENLLAHVTSRNLLAKLNLSAVGPGSQWITLETADIQVPQPLEVTRITPRQVKVRVEPRVTRQVRVVADVTGTPADGLKVRGIRVTPEQVTLTGPQSVFGTLTRVRTQPVDLTGLTETMRREVRLDLRGRDLTVLKAPTIYVTITLLAAEPTTPESP